MVNTEKGLLEVQRMACPGMKLSCQLKVQSSVWLATEVTAGLQGPCQGELQRDAVPGEWVQMWKGTRCPGLLDYQVTPAVAEQALEQCHQGTHCWLLLTVTSWQLVVKVMRIDRDPQQEKLMCWWHAMSPNDTVRAREHSSSLKTF